MVWWNEACRDAGGAADACARGLEAWITSLPWVVERPLNLGLRGGRTFAVDCEPLAIRRLWLVTGLPPTRGIAAVFPERVAAELELAGLARPVATLPAGHVLVEEVAAVTCDDVEWLVLEAYHSAMS